MSENSVIVETQHPIAFNSPDHLFPCGTAKDNSVNLSFNKKIFRLFRGDSPEEGIGLKILDLGCAGGGFVNSCINQGAFAVGIEGSDYSFKMQRAHWPILGNRFLFTADITKPFSVKIIEGGERKQVIFDVITLWEVLEHIQEADLGPMMESIKLHMAPHSLLFASIATFDCYVKGINLHQTVQKIDWWEKFFKVHGFHMIKKYDSFFNSSYVRGPDTGGSFNVVLSLDPSLAPPAIELSFKEKLYEYWYSSKMFKIARKLLVPELGI